MSEAMYDDDEDDDSMENVLDIPPDLTPSVGEAGRYTAKDAAEARTIIKMEAEASFGDKNLPDNQKPCWTIIDGEHGWKHFLPNGVLTKVTPCGLSTAHQHGGSWKRAECPTCNAYCLKHRHVWQGVRDTAAAERRAQERQEGCYR